MSSGVTGDHACAIRLDNTVVCWGNDDFDQASPPAGTFVDLAGGVSHTCGIRSGGDVECWGLDTDGQARLGADIESLCKRLDRGTASLVVPGEYLEVVIER